MELIKTIVVALLSGVVAATGVAFVSPKDSVPSFGALSGPDIPSQYLSWGGTREWRFTESMSVASTTCSFQSPAASSTLRYAIAQVTRSSTGATLQYEWGKAATAFATTTSLGTGTIASGASGTASASTTVSGTIIDQTTVIAPNTWINLKIGSSTPTTQSGNCYISFIEHP